MNSMNLFKWLAIAMIATIPILLSFASRDTDARLSLLTCAPGAKGCRTGRTSKSSERRRAPRRQALLVDAG